ncbi:MAG: MmgE/PrpD family protein [Desulfobacterales bacterium]|nr:MmgE/PrpD family protein [Desulfobacterales bacterium]
MTFTSSLVEQIVDFDCKSIPKEVLEHAKLFVLDTLGCALGGYATEPGKQIAAEAEEYKGADSATVVGSGQSAALPFACWANASLANLLDMDDVFAGTAHQANCLVPTALAVAETEKKSGLEVLQAVVLGFEVGSRIMMYSWPPPEKARTYFPSTWQVFDAVTVAGHLLGLKKEQLQHAFGLAGMVPPIPIDMKKFVERPMGFSKNPFGWTTFTGVFWTILARRGLSGVADVFDGDAGFWAMMGSNRYDPEQLLKDFGTRYNILDTKYKPYPFCTWGHTSLDAFAELIAGTGIDPEEIEGIEVHTVKRAVDFLFDTKMNSLYDAQFSLPHALSMIALKKKPGPEWMQPENIFDHPVAKQIASKVTMQADQTAEKVFDEEKGAAIPATVIVTTVSGQRHTNQKKYSKGTKNNPFTEKELKEKFNTLASSALDDDRVEKIQSMVENLETVGDVSDLLKLLAR